MKRFWFLLLICLPLTAEEGLDKADVDHWLEAVQQLSQWAARSPERVSALDSMLVEPEQVLAELQRHGLTEDVSLLVTRAGFADLPSWASVNFRIQRALLALESRDEVLVGQLEDELAVLRASGYRERHQGRIAALERTLAALEKIQRESRQDQAAIWPHLTRIRDSLGLDQ
ncbi:hypothetical protein [Gallaecimonas sp. GXIMD4217]|uniref:hypothetical protein n=1 Tax=Gallaecimonas sp. GXIMD4217 TaxID=3131927 RepID=UPI00311B29E3